MAICGVLDQARRQAEKAEARRADAEDIRSGRVSQAEMSRRNGVFSSIDLKGARIVSIGGRAVSGARPKKA